MDKMDEFHIPKDALKKLKNTEYLRKELSEGKSLKEIIGYSESVMEKFYAAAYRLFQMKEYTKSADAFLFLTTLDPYVYNFWLGLGMSEQLKEDYENALVAYSMAILLDAHNPLPHFHSATCYQKTDNVQDTRASLELAIEYAGDQAEFMEIKKKSQEILWQLNQ